jgi:GGDEF domain-containing protein
MTRIRIRVVLLVCWLLILFSADQLLLPFGISGVTYGFMLAMVITTLSIKRLAQVPWWVVLILPIPFLSFLEVLNGGMSTSAPILLLIAEICILSITTILAIWVGQSIVEVENTVEHITIGRRDRLPIFASEGQGFIYREIRRARNHQRPLVLLAVKIEEKSINVALDRMVQEAQMNMMRQYALSGVSKSLCEKLEDCDIVVQSNDQFIVVLPETTPEDLPRLIERLRQQVFDQVGVDLSIGTASLPDDGFTFDGLIDKAVKQMNGDIEATLVFDFGHVPAEHEIN